MLYNKIYVKNMSLEICLLFIIVENKILYYIITILIRCEWCNKTYN